MDTKENFFNFRLLDTDNVIFFLKKLSIEIFVTSADVLHSWTIPRMGFKADANPGRINYILFNPYKNGIFFGQCSELCGSNHSFMPISALVSNFNSLKN